MVLTGPTRKDSVLDVFLTNFDQYITGFQTCFPLEGEVGETSDHQIVLLEALLPRPKSFKWEVHEYLKITKDGIARFKEKLDKEDWAVLHSFWPDHNKMAE